MPLLPAPTLAALFGSALLAPLGPQSEPGKEAPRPAQAAPEAQPAAPHMIPPAKEGELPCDSKDGKPVLVGATTRKAVLEHREVFQANTAKAEIRPEWRRRWKELSTPCVLVAAFGSWCGDSQRELPDLLALMAEESPFVKVHLVGVYRDKKTTLKDWPQGLEPQPVAKVPTFWLFVQQPGGAYRLVDSIVEAPPKVGQRMAEAVLEMIEKVR